MEVEVRAFYGAACLCSSLVALAMVHVAPKDWTCIPAIILATIYGYWFLKEKSE